MKTIKSQSADKLWILGREDPNDFEWFILSFFFYLF